MQLLEENMFIKQKKKMLFTGIISLIILGCPSHEYTSAKLYIQNKEWEKAEEFLFKALEVEPDNVEVMIRIGYHVHAKKGEWDQMNEMFDKAMALDPEKKIPQINQTNQTNQTVKEMVKNYRVMFWADNYNSAVGLFNEYKASREKSTLEKAIQKFEESANVDPTQGPTYSLLAACYSELGNEELAVHNARKATEIMPDDFQSNLALGQILSQTGNKEESVTFVKKAIDIDPSNATAIRKLAVLYFEEGEIEKSVETFEAAIKTETDKMRKSELYFNLGVLNKQLNNFEDAEIAFEEAFYLNDKDYEAIRGMAEAYEELGDNYRLGKDGFEKNPFQSARWYRKAEKKFKFIMDIDLDNESTYKKYIEQLRYKRNIVENN